MKIGILSVIIILAGVALTACGEKSVDLMQFATVNFLGIDSKGNAEVKVDWSDFETQLSEVLGYSLADSGKIMRLEDTIKFSVDVEENLTNGDKVKLSVVWGKDAAKKSGLIFTGKSSEIDVFGLTEATDVDLFKDVEIDYEGVSPRATVNIRNTSSDAFLKSVTYSIDNSIPFNPTIVANGDVLTLTANYNKKQAEEKGYLIESDKKEYTVAGIDEYISKYSQIDKVTLDKMDEQGRAVIEAKLASVYTAGTYLHPGTYKIVEMDKLKIDEVKSVDHYFFALKKGAEKGYYDSDSSLFILYEVSFSDNFSTAGDIAYISIFYNDMILRSDGKLDIIIVDAEIGAHSNNFDDAYRDVVTANKAKYDCEEISISEKNKIA